MLTHTDGEGYEAYYAYNADNQVWCSVDAADASNGTTCPSITPPTSIPGTSYPGTTIKVYNSSDQLTAVIGPLGNTTTYSYTSGVSGVPNGLVYCSVDPANYANGVSCPSYSSSHVTGTTTETYDSAGDVTSTTDPDGRTTTYSYGVSGYPSLVSSETDPSGTTTSFSYNSAGNLTLKTVSLASYSATTEYSYDGSQRLVCEVDPYEYANSVRCPTGTITTPTPTSDSYLGATITTYDSDGRVTQVTNPLGGISYSAYDAAGEVYCTVAPYEAAAERHLPVAAAHDADARQRPLHRGDDHDLRRLRAGGAGDQPARGHHPHDLRPGRQRRHDDGRVRQLERRPNIVTTYSYDADNRVDKTVVGSGSGAATTLQYYDPNGNVFCSVSANAYAQGPLPTSARHWQTSWIAAPTEAGVALFDDSHLEPGEQRHDRLLRRRRRRAADDQPRRRDVDLGLRRRRAHLLHLGPGERGRLADGALVEHLSLSVPDEPADDATDRVTPATRPPSTTPPGSRPRSPTARQHHHLRLRLGRPPELGDRSRQLGDRLLLLLPVRLGAVRRGRLRAAGVLGTTCTSRLSRTARRPPTPTTRATQLDTTTTAAGTTTDAYDGFGDLTAETYSSTASGYSAPSNLSYTYYVDGSRETMTDGTGTTTYTPDANGDVTHAGIQRRKRHRAQLEARSATATSRPARSPRSCTRATPGTARRR